MHWRDINIRCKDNNVYIVVSLQPYVHGDARRAETEQPDGDELYAGRVSRKSQVARGIPHAGQNAMTASHLQVLGGGQLGRPGLRLKGKILVQYRDFPRPMLTRKYVGWDIFWPTMYVHGWNWTNIILYMEKMYNFIIISNIYGRLLDSEFRTTT